MVKKVGPYELSTVIGKGTFGTVYLGKHSQTNLDIAVKVIPKESLKQELQVRLEQEIICQKSVSSDFIVKLLDVQKTENNFYLILEYCKGGDLASFIKKNGKVSEEVASKWLRQLAEAFRVLDEKNIIHRDLKLQNILMTENSSSASLKLADFGLSRFLDGDLAKTCVGTPLYMAPEIINMQEYDNKADIWSLGLVLYELLTGSLPLKVLKREQIREAQRNLISPPESLSFDCKDLLSKLLAYDPNERISFNELLSHPFISAPNEESFSDLEEDFVLLERDESVGDQQVIMKDFHPMINLQLLTDSVIQTLETSDLLWSIGAKHLEPENSSFALYVKICELIEQKILEVNQSIKKFALSEANAGTLFDKFHHLKLSFRIKLAECDKCLAAQEITSGEAEKCLLKISVDLCNQASQHEFLKNYELSIIKYQEALKIILFLTSFFCDKSSCDFQKISGFVSDTEKRLKTVKTKLCLI